MVATFLAEIALWASLTGVFYIYVGYPALIWLLARIRPLRTRVGHVDVSISVVIVVHNEAKRIGAKLRSVLTSYDSERICEVIVASDGSTDDTVQQAVDVGDGRIRVLDYPVRRGKPSVLNDTIPLCKGEIVVLTDARQELHPSAVSHLVQNFADKLVGVVSGELVFYEPNSSSTAAKGIGIYWTYEKFIRRNEARFRGVPGATGALYAIRKSLFRPIPPQTLLDDVVIPMQVIVAGSRCLFESAAIAYDIPSDSPTKEAVRKRRTIAGAAQLVVDHPEWLLPWRNPIWFEFVSHKLARLVSPLLLFVAAIANIVLVWHPAYRVLLSIHVCFYLSALAGWLIQQRGDRSKCFAAQMMFVTLNMTTLLALWDAFRGHFRATWQKTT